MTPTFGYGRIRFRVDRIELDAVGRQVACGVVTGTGHPLRVQVRVLTRGLRCAKLELPPAVVDTKDIDKVGGAR